MVNMHMEFFAVGIGVVMQQLKPQPARLASHIRPLVWALAALLLLQLSASTPEKAWL